VQGSRSSIFLSEFYSINKFLIKTEPFFIFFKKNIIKIHPNVIIYSKYSYLVICQQNANIKSLKKLVFSNPRDKQDVFLKIAIRSG